MNTLDIAVNDLSERLKADLADLEEDVTTYSLADAIREGASKARQCHTGWSGADGSVCALSMAAAAVRARGLD